MFMHQPLIGRPAKGNPHWLLFQPTSLPEAYCRPNGSVLDNPLPIPIQSNPMVFSNNGLPCIRDSIWPEIPQRQFWICSCKFQKFDFKEGFYWNSGFSIQCGHSGNFWNLLMCLSGYNVSRLDRIGRGGGVVIFTKDNFYVSVSLATSVPKRFDWLALNVGLGHDNQQTLVGVYYPPSAPSCALNQLIWNLRMVIWTILYGQF